MSLTPSSKADAVRGQIGRAASQLPARQARLLCALVANTNSDGAARATNAHLVQRTGLGKGNVPTILAELAAARIITSEGKTHRIHDTGAWGLPFIPWQDLPGETDHLPAEIRDSIAKVMLLRSGHGASITIEIDDEIDASAHVETGPDFWDAPYTATEGLTGPKAPDETHDAAEAVQGPQEPLQAPQNDQITDLLSYQSLKVGKRRKLA